MYIIHLLKFNPVILFFMIFRKPYQFCQIKICMAYKAVASSNNHLATGFNIPLKASSKFINVLEIIERQPKSELSPSSMAKQIEQFELGRPLFFKINSNPVIFVNFLKYSF